MKNEEQKIRKMIKGKLVHTKKLGCSFAPVGVQTIVTIAAPLGLAHPHKFSLMATKFYGIKINSMFLSFPMNFFGQLYLPCFHYFNHF